MTAGVIDTRNFAESYEQTQRRLRLLEQQISNPDLQIGANGGGTGTFEEIIIENPGVGSDLVINFTNTVPTGLGAITSTYLDEVYIDASWTPVGDVASEYEVELARRTSPGVYDNPRVYRTAGSTVRMIVPLGGVTYGIRVAAINRLGIRSAFSARIDVNTAVDSTIPGTVGGLSVTAGLSSLVVTFTRLSDADMQNGDGLYRIQLSSNNFSSILADKYTSSNVEVFDGLTPGTNYKVRVAGIDPSGNQGPYTTSADTAPGYVTNTHIVANTINGDRISAATIQGAKIVAGSVDGDRITTNTLDANRIKTSTLTAADITIAGGSLIVGTPITADGALLNSQGFKLYKDGQVTVNMDALTGDASFTGNLIGSVMRGGRILSASIEGEGIDQVNLMPNGHFNLNETGWTTSFTANNGIMERVVAPAVALNGGPGEAPLIRARCTSFTPFTGSGGSITYVSDWIPCTGDENHFFSVKFRGVGNTSANTTTNASMSILISQRNSSAVSTGSNTVSQITVVNNTTWATETLNGDFTSAPTAVEYRISISVSGLFDGQLFWDDFFVSQSGKVSGFMLQTRGEPFASAIMKSSNNAGVGTTHSLTFEQFNRTGVATGTFSSITSDQTVTNAVNPTNTQTRLMLTSGQWSGRRSAKINLWSATASTSPSDQPSLIELVSEKYTLWCREGDNEASSVPYGRMEISLGIVDIAAASSTETNTLRIQTGQGTSNLIFGGGAVYAATAWTNVTFENSWQNYGTPGFRGVQYRKVGDEVQIRGLAARAGDSLTTIFTLPAGFRPGQPEIFGCYSGGGVVRIDVGTGGTVTVVLGGAGFASYLSLAGIRFSTT